MCLAQAAHMLDEMRTGHKAVVQLAHPEDGWGREAINGTIEVVFEDGTRSPFCFSCAPSDFIDGRLPLKGKLERVVVSTDGQVNALTLPASSSLEVTHDACGNRTTTSNSVTVCDVGYVAIERKSVSGMGHCTCGKRISANKKSCFACMQAEGGNRVN
jgi:hypothetical protein